MVKTLLEVDSTQSYEEITEIVFGFSKDFTSLQMACTYWDILGVSCL